MSISAGTKRGRLHSLCDFDQRGVEVPACGTVKDTRENYTDENFLDTIAKRAGIREAAEC